MNNKSAQLTHFITDLLQLPALWEEAGFDQFYFGFRNGNWVWKPSEGASIEAFEEALAKVKQGFDDDCPDDDDIRELVKVGEPVDLPTDLHFIFEAVKKRDELKLFKKRVEDAQNSTDWLAAHFDSDGFIGLYDNDTGVLLRVYSLASPDSEDSFSELQLAGDTVILGEHFEPLNDNTIQTTLDDRSVTLSAVYL